MVTLFQTDDFYDPNKSQRRNCENFVLKPDPILTLDRIMGVQPRHHAGTVHFNHDEKSASEILYSQANCIVGYHAKLQKQRLLLDPQIGSIDNLTVCKGYAVSTYFRPNGKFSKQFAMPLTDLVITIWCLESSSVLMNLKTPFLSIRNIAISSDQTALAVNGLDSD